MASREGTCNFSNKKKAEIIVVAENESTQIACKRYEVTRRAIDKWKQQLETNVKLQNLYESAKESYQKDLLTPAEMGARAITNRIIDIARDGVKYKGELRETQEAFRALTEAVMLYRHQKNKEDLLNELKEDQ